VSQHMAEGCTTGQACQHILCSAHQACRPFCPEMKPRTTGKPATAWVMLIHRKCLCWYARSYTQYVTAGIKRAGRTLPNRHCLLLPMYATLPYESMQQR
jgi:hypothetical protein